MDGSPLPQAFSQEYFNQITFSSVSTVYLPYVLRPSSLRSFHWERSSVVSDGASSIWDQSIPCAEDLRLIIQQIPKCATHGYKTVVLDLDDTVTRQFEERAYSLDQIRTCVVISNNELAVCYAANLARTLLESDHRQALDIFRRLSHLPIRSPLSGFSGKVYAYHLGSLVNTELVEDDIVDLRMELAYLQASELFPSERLFILPILFAPSLLHAYTSTPRHLPPQLTPLRDGLIKAVKEGTFHSLSFMWCHNFHYTSYCYRLRDAGTLWWGDSLQGPPVELSLLVNALCWFLSETPLPPVQGTRSMNLPQQAAGSNACAIYAFAGLWSVVTNGIGCSSLSTLDPAATRVEWIIDLLMHHVRASAFPNLDWYDMSQVLLSDNFDDAQTENPEYAYSDWTGYSVMGDHPVFHSNFLLGPLQNSNGPNTGEIGSSPVRTPPFRPSTSIPQQFEDDMPAAPLFSPLNSPPAPCPDSPPLPEASDLANGSWPIRTPIKVAARCKSPAIDLTMSSPPAAAHPGTANLPHAPRTTTLGNALSTAKPLSKKPEATTMATELEARGTQKRRRAEVVDLTTSPENHKKPVKSAGIPLPPTIEVVSSEDESDAGSDYLPGYSSPSDSSDVFMIPNPRLTDGLQPGWKVTRSGVIVAQPSGHVNEHVRRTLGYRVQLGDVFRSLEEAVAIISAEEEAHGYIMRLGGKKCREADGSIKKRVIRCQSYRRAKETHNLAKHPSDLRQSGTHKAKCSVHYNLNSVSSSPTQFYLSSAVTDHSNHPIPLAPGAPAPKKIDAKHHQLVKDYTHGGNFTRAQMATILQVQHPEAPLTNRQLGNLINNKKRDEAQEIEEDGGDINALIAKLEAAHQEDPRNSYRIRADPKTQRVVSLFFQSAGQYEALRRWGDILLCDSSYGRNRYGWAVHVGIVLNGFNQSVNTYYAFFDSEDVDSYIWLLRHVKSLLASMEPLLSLRVIASDRLASFIIAIREVFVTVFHLYCLHHLGGNIREHIRPIVGDQWPEFQDAFWRAYRGVSPLMFDVLWKKMLRAFPRTEAYLNKNIYPEREHFAFAWISLRFTAGIQTTGCVESENRNIKSGTMPKLGFVQLYNALTKRTTQQKTREQESVQAASRQKHKTTFEVKYAPILTLAEQHLVPFAFHRVWDEIKLSTDYTVSEIVRPAMFPDWRSFFLRRSDHQKLNDLEFVESDGEGAEGQFQYRRRDSVYIATEWLLYRIFDRNEQIVAAFSVHVNHKHLVVLLRDGAYLCDCCLGVNLGLPCRHYFAVLKHCPHLRFHLALVEPRWLQNPRLDLSSIPPVTTSHLAHDERLRVAPERLSNPHGAPGPSPMASPSQPATHVVSSQYVYSQSQAAVQKLARYVRTDDDLRRVMGGIQRIQDIEEEKALQMMPFSASAVNHLNPGLTAGAMPDFDSRLDYKVRPTQIQFENPPIPSRLKFGRPPNARLAPAHEGSGRPKGGGGQSKHRASYSLAALPTESFRPPSNYPNLDPFDSSVLPATGPRRLSFSDSLPPIQRVDLTSPPPAPPARRNKCGNCGQPGHNRTTCTTRHTQH